MDLIGSNIEETKALKQGYLLQKLFWNIVNKV